MKVLITGVQGFAGSHLADFLAADAKMEVFGLARPGSDERRPRRLKVLYADIEDRAGVERCLKKMKPARIFHLAGRSSVKASWDDPLGTLASNLAGCLNLLQSVRELKFDCRVLLAGSGDEYGKVAAKDVPIKEKHALKPVSPYAVSKAGQELLADQYVEDFGMRVVKVRAFPHIGPRQKPDFAVSDFARQTALIESGRLKPVLRVGNLGAIRDFTDVRDVVRAYRLVLEKGGAGEAYNVCSGRGRRLREAVDVLLKHSRVKMKVAEEASRKRVTDIPVLVGDPSKLRKKTGWKPRIPFERSVLDTLAYWRDRT